jgi:2-C-methyl-D-erythritol 4-phosphate cytidylyltransferase
VSPPSGDASDSEEGELKVGVVVPAAGCGQRMGGLAKPFLELCGEPVLMRALRPFLDHPAVQEVIVSLSPDHAESPPAWLIEADRRIRVVAGGETRRDSVWAGLQELSDGLDVAVVHDGARPLVSREVVGRCIAVAGRGACGVAGVPAVDTMKEVDEDGVVVATPDRSRLWHAQTPQAFPLDVIMAAYRRAFAEDFPATDDAALVERLGGRVVMVESSADNLKITRPEDLEMARLMLSAPEEPPTAL